MTGFLVHLQHLLECQWEDGGKNQWEVTGSLQLKEQYKPIRWVVADFWHCQVPLTCELSFASFLLSWFWHQFPFSATLARSSVLPVSAHQLTLILSGSSSSEREQIESPASAFIKKLTASFLVHWLFSLLLPPAVLFSPSLPTNLPFSYLLSFLLC